MKKNVRIIYIIIIGILLVTSAFAVVMYQHEKNSADAAGTAETADSADTEAPEAEDTQEQETEEVYVEPLIAVVDYDTEDAERVMDRLSRAGLESERVGAIEELDADRFDAIIVPGGHSVTPSMYGAERQPETKDTDIEKDKFQFAAVQMFIDAEKPVLGICRGEQLVNNVLGGTTIQHMDDGWHKKNRAVKIAEGTWLYDMYGTEAVTYHYHHQCVDELGDGLYATQWDAESGCIEAYEHRTLPVYGLQWHPDATEMGDEGVRVFEEFGKLVKENMTRQQIKG